MRTYRLRKFHNTSPRFEPCAVRSQIRPTSAVSVVTPGTINGITVAAAVTTREPRTTPWAPSSAPGSHVRPADSRTGRTVVLVRISHSLVSALTRISISCESS